MRSPTIAIEPGTPGGAFSGTVAKRYGVLALIAFSFLPLLCLHAHHLWQNPHYQFFPLLLAAVVFLAWKRWPTVIQPLTTRQRRAQIAFLVVGLLLLVLATLLLSALLGMIAAIFTAGGLMLTCAGRQATSRLLSVWLLLWLLVPLPFGMDYRLIAELQIFTSKASSLVLEVIGIHHMMSGNVLELPGQRRLVDEACSGIQSLYSLFAFAAIFVVWTRKPVLRSVGLLVSAIFWAVLANVIRVLTIAVAFASMGIDLSSGWQHETLGVVVFVLASVMLLCTDQLLYFLLAPIDEMSPIESEQSPFSRLWNRVLGDQKASPSETAETTAPTTVAEPPAGRGFGLITTRWAWAAGVFGALLGLVQVAALLSSNARTQLETRAAAAIDADALPELQDGWKRLDYKLVSRETSSIWGQYSKSWVYQTSSGVAQVSCDFPFDGWHELPFCYRSQGWEVVRRNVVKPGQAEGRVVEVEMKKSSGEHAYLVFAFLDGEGRDFTTGIFERIAKGLARGPLRVSFSTYQLQVLVASEAPLSAEDRTEVRGQFINFREQLRQHWNHPA